MEIRWRQDKGQDSWVSELVLCCKDASRLLKDGTLVVRSLGVSLRTRNSGDGDEVGIKNCPFCGVPIMITDQDSEDVRNWVNGLGVEEFAVEYKKMIWTPRNPSYNSRVEVGKVRSWMDERLEIWSGTANIFSDEELPMLLGVCERLDKKIAGRMKDDL